jgi:putative hydrolase of the HAD superfamily
MLENDSPKIKNAIFDVGNVLVAWNPITVLEKVFSEYDPIDLYNAMLPVWIDLNLGSFSEKKAIKKYQKQLDLPKDKLEQLMQEIKTSH